MTDAGLGGADRGAPAAQGEDRRGQGASSTRPASTSSTARPRPRSRPRSRSTACRCSTRSCWRCPTASRSTRSSSSSSSSAARRSGAGGGIVWAHAEALAFASLLTEGIPIRLTGQDTERGTFSQRHLVLHDPKTGQEHCAIQHLPGALAPMELHNSPLSEMALPRLRVRLLAGGPGDARAVGGAVRRLRQRRAGDHRPVHRLRAGQVGPDLATDAAAAARLRGLRPRALLGAARALPAARRRGQHPGRQPHDAGAVLPPAAPPGADRQAAAARRHDAEEPAAPAAGDERASTSLAEGRFQPVLAEPGVDRRAGHAADPVQRQDLLRPRRPRTMRKDNPQRRDRPRRAALPVPAGRDPGAGRELPAAARGRVGPGGAAQHGRARAHVAAAAADAPGAAQVRLHRAARARRLGRGLPGRARRASRTGSSRPRWTSAQPVSQYPRKLPGER